MKPGIRAATLAPAAGLYLFIVLYLMTTNDGVSLIILIYIGACVFIAWQCYQTTLKRQAIDSAAFRKNFPLNRYGQTMSSFQYVFFSESLILPEVDSAIKQSVVERTPLLTFNQVTFRDEDKSLLAPEARTFFRGFGPENTRGTSINLIMHTNMFGKMQSLSWWIVASGYVDPAKVFNFIAYAPFLLPFWIVPYARQTYDLMQQIRTVHESFYNNLDVLTEVRSVQKIVFDTLASTLDKHGVDTSDLKAQRGQVMNVSITGGRTNIGQIIQGSINRMSQQPTQQVSQAA